MAETNERKFVIRCSATPPSNILGAVQEAIAQAQAWQPSRAEVPLLWHHRLYEQLRKLVKHPFVLLAPDGLYGLAVDGVPVFPGPAIDEIILDVVIPPPPSLLP